ncbi:MAG: hypothetical protein WBB50_02220 [Methyloceanibacter sp.]|jgi:hypothetical protein
MRPRHFTHAALLAATLIMFSTAAGAVTERQKQDCKADYQRYCNAYAVGSEGLRACMSRSAKKLSNTCVAALVDAGDMTKAQADKLRKTPAKKTTAKKTSSKKTASTKTTKKRTTQKRGSWNPFSQP